jgi:hypothetical protein
MSRTKHHSLHHGSVKQGEGHKQRAFGYDFWTARPGNYAGGSGPEVKRETHRLERLQDKQVIKEELKEDCDG